MMRLGINSLAAGLLALLAGYPAMGAEAQSQAPDFLEVYDLLRAHLTGVTEAELNRAAAQALVSALGPKVSLVTNGPATNVPASPELVAKASLFDDNFAYLRVGSVNDGLAKAIRDAYQQLDGSNQLKGVVLDLRYAGGQDYAAAAAAADLFVKGKRPLLDWGDGPAQSKAKDDVITAPVAVLVNAQTTGAAEALAAVLRETGSGLMVGSQTAGQAMIAREFPLKNGQRLRIATAPVRLGDGTALSGRGLTPDILVQVSSHEERAYYADAFQAMPRSNPPAASSGQTLTNQAAGTNLATRRARFNEAELVRERKEGFNPEVELPRGRDNEPEKPLVRDPALARALDVLKGLAVVRQSRS